jgi:hypothetical protein
MAWRIEINAAVADGVVDNDRNYSIVVGIWGEGGASSTL